MSATRFRLGAFLVILAWLGALLEAQTIVNGPTARTAFESYVTNHGDQLLDFNSLSVGALSTQLQGSLGLQFYSTIQTNGSLINPPHNVYVTSTTVGGVGTLKIVGTPFPGGSDDGRVGYEIRFTNPQARAGIDRLWQANASITRFFNSAGTLLATHTNTVNNEFVGYLADFNNPLTWVSRVEMDGLSVGGTRQVGYADNLFWGVSAIPEPGTYVLLLAGLGLLWGWRRQRALR